MVDSTSADMHYGPLSAMHETVVQVQSCRLKFLNNLSLSESQHTRNFHAGSKIPNEVPDRVYVQTAECG